jgi:hypothetical protein
MTTYDLSVDQGRIFAFEIENMPLGRRGVCRVAKSIPGCTIKRTPVFFSWFREDSFCEFEVDGELYEAFEPFGDNSRYWIGPKNITETDRWRPQTKKVREAFEKASHWSFGG